MASGSQPQTNESVPIDPIWASSRTARQIYSLGVVEQDISRLLSLAASSISLLTLPETDGPDDGLPQGGERSEQFVLEVSEYFERLDSIHIAIRSSLAHIRQSRIAPSAINAPNQGFVPSSFGVGLPSTTNTPASTQVSGSTSTSGTVVAPPSSLGSGGSGGGGLTGNQVAGSRGLQEERVERDAWKMIQESLKKLKELKVQEAAASLH